MSDDWIDLDCGDVFLLEDPRYLGVVRSYFESKVDAEVSDDGPPLGAKAPRIGKAGAPSPVGGGEVRAATSVGANTV